MTAPCMEPEGGAGLDVCDRALSILTSAATSRIAMFRNLFFIDVDYLEMARSSVVDFMPSPIWTSLPRAFAARIKDSSCHSPSATSSHANAQYSPGAMPLIWNCPEGLVTAVL